MANVTIYEHFEIPDADLGAKYPADVKTTIASTSSLPLRADTKYVVICSDADCRISFDGNTPAASEMPILSAVPNPFLLSAAGQTVKFL